MQRAWRAAGAFTWWVCGVLVGLVAGLYLQPTLEPRQPATPTPTPPLVAEPPVDTTFTEQAAAAYCDEARAHGRPAAWRSAAGVVSVQVEARPGERASTVLRYVVRRVGGQPGNTRLRVQVLNADGAVLAEQGLSSSPHDSASRR